MDIVWSNISPDDFEDIVAALLRAMGYENVQRRAGPGDRGWDIDATLPLRDPAGHLTLQRWRVECKQHRQAPSPSLIRDHYARMRVDVMPNTRLLFVTLHPLTNNTKDDLSRTAIQDRLEVSWWDARDLTTLISRHLRNQPLASLLLNHLRPSYSLEHLRNACSLQVRTQITLRVGKKYIPDLFETTDTQAELQRFLGEDIETAQIHDFYTSLIHSLGSPAQDPQPDSRPAELSDKAKRRAQLLTSIRRAATWTHVEALLPEFLDLTEPVKRDLVPPLLLQARRFRRNCFLIRDKAGSGKTTALCAAAESLDSTQYLALFLSGKYDLPTDRPLLDTLAHTLHSAVLKVLPTAVAYEEPRHLLLEIALLLQQERLELILLIDAINESRHLAELDELLVRGLVDLNTLPIKFVITCRDIFWRYFDESQWKPFLFASTPHDLPPFPPNRIDAIVDKYLARFNVTGSVLGPAREQCRQPLLLRFLCEAHRDRSIGQLSDLRLLELFELYWQRKNTDIATRLGMGTAGALRVEAFLLQLVDDMVAGRSTTISLGRVAAVTGEADLDTAASLYQNLLDEDIILEEMPPLEAFDTSYHARRVSFVYDEFFDYLVALSTFRKEHWDEHNMRGIAMNLINLIERINAFPELRGAAIYAVLVSERKGMHMVLCALLARLGEYEILCSVAGKLRSPATMDWMGGVFRTCLHGSALRRNGPPPAHAVGDIRAIVSASDHIFEELTSEPPSTQYNNTPDTGRQYVLVDSADARDIVLHDELPSDMSTLYATEGHLAVIDAIAHTVWQLPRADPAAVTAMLLDWSNRRGITRLGCRVVLRRALEKKRLSLDAIVSMIADCLLSADPLKQAAGVNLLLTLEPEAMLQIAAAMPVTHGALDSIRASALRALIMKYPDRLPVASTWLLSQPDACSLAEDVFSRLGLPWNMDADQYYCLWQDLHALKRSLDKVGSRDASYMRPLIDLAFDLRGRALRHTGNRHGWETSDWQPPNIWDSPNEFL